MGALESSVRQLSHDTHQPMGGGIRCPIPLLPYAPKITKNRKNSQQHNVNESIVAAKLWKRDSGAVNSAQAAPWDG